MHCLGYSNAKFSGSRIFWDGGNQSGMCTAHTYTFVPQNHVFVSVFPLEGSRLEDLRGLTLQVRKHRGVSQTTPSVAVYRRTSCTQEFLQITIRLSRKVHTKAWCGDLCETTQHSPLQNLSLKCTVPSNKENWGFIPVFNSVPTRIYWKSFKVDNVTCSQLCRLTVQARNCNMEQQDGIRGAFNFWLVHDPYR